MLAVGVLGGCGTVTERRDDVHTAATTFEKAIDDGAYDRVCALLAPATVEELEESAGSPCATAVSQDSPPPGGPVQRTDLYGNQARVVLSSDTLFLSRFAAGWKVVAADCAPQPNEPYRCRIKGG
ncbi:hypothetical protein [Streptomyces sp. NPDC003635]